MTPAEWLAQSRFIRWAFLDNTWVLAHAFLGVLLANGLYLVGHWSWLTGILPCVECLQIRWIVVLLTLAGALAWDYLIEPLLERRIHGPGWRVKIYGSRLHWFLDSVGDVLAAVGFAAMSVYSLPSLF